MTDKRKDLKKEIFPGIEKSKTMLQPYYKDLIYPPAEKLKNKLQLFDLKEADIPFLPAICRGMIEPVFFTPAKKIDPRIGELHPYVKNISPKSLDHLKEMVGVPTGLIKKDQVIKNNKFQEKLHMMNLREKKVNLNNFPNQRKISFELLKPEERLAVNSMAFNLIHGYATKESMSEVQFKVLEDYILMRSRNLTLFAACDLIVCPGHTVVFNNFPMLFFINVLVYGSGKIVLGNNTKLHAYQIKHVEEYTEIF